MSNITISSAARLLSEAEHILLVCHIHSDGDTLGSAFGLKHAMEAKGHTVRVLCDEKIPDRLKFITDFQAELFEYPLEGFTPDIICSIDAAEPSLMGSYGEKEFDLKLDHHGSGSHYAKYNFIDGSYAACAEIIYSVICELEALDHATLTQKCATALYAAVSSDTGCFKYSNVTSSTMRIAAALIDKGADYENVCRRLFETRSMGETLAQKMTLNNLKFYRSNTVAVISVSSEMKAEYGVCDEDLGAIGSYLREIEGVELAIVIKQSEKESGKYRISMRSGAEINSSDMCANFGGGGHARAAGGSVAAESSSDAEKKVMEKVLQVLAENN